MGEKGSLKNLYKDLKMRLEFRKKEKNKEKKFQKDKSIINLNVKAKFSFFLALKLMFGLFIELFSTSQKKDSKRINIIVKDSVKLEEKIDEIIAEVSKIDSKVELNRYQEEISKIETAYIKENKNVSTSIEKKIESTNIEKKIADVKKVIEKKQVTQLNHSVEVVKENKIIEEKKINLNDDLKLNKDEIKKLNKKYDEILEDKDNNKLEELLELQKVVNELKRIIDLRENDFSLDDLKNIDDYLRINNNDELEKLREKIENKIKQIKEPIIIPIDIIKENNEEAKLKFQENTLEKSNVTSDNNPKSKQILELKKEEEKLKEQKRKIDNSLKDDLIMSTSVINHQIVVMEKSVKEARKVLNNKPSLFKKISHLASNTIKICASVSPLFFFKNKGVGLFTSSILLNNSIRSLRRSISNKTKSIEYIRTNGLSEIINEHQELEIKTKRILDDSLEQILSFKDQFTSNYGNYINFNQDVRDIYIQIEEIENYILTQQLKFEKDNNKVKKYINNTYN